MDSIKPLGFHRVMEGNPIAAYDSPLFRVPTEVLAEIVDYLGANPADVASLAFVNSDFRQLARSWQFRKVTLDNTPRGIAFVAALLSEAPLRQQNKLGLSLGACIRHVEISSEGYMEKAMAIRPRKPGFSTDDHSDEAFDDDEEKLDRWRSELDVLTKEYNISAQMILQSLKSLPHLYSLELTCKVLDWALMNWLRSFTTVRHLTQVRFEVTEEIPCADACLEWPLETLEINLTWRLGLELCSRPRHDLDASQHWYHLLRPCAPSLQSLELGQSILILPFAGLVDRIKEKPVSFDLQFPKLRYLKLNNPFGDNFDASSLRSLILTSTCLAYLSVNFGNYQIRRLLQNAGRIPTLKTLILSNYFPLTEEAEKNERISLSFLDDNPQLTGFAFRKPTLPHLIEDALSKLSRSQLTRLSLSWRGKENPEENFTTLQHPTFSEIPETALRAMSNMVAVQDLHLDCISTARMNAGYMRDWYVDHNILRQHLGPSLCSLKRLALTRDIYKYPLLPPLPLPQPTNLPTLLAMPADPPYSFHSYTDLRLVDSCWETHLQHMREQAVWYAETFPRLEFLHIGERSFGITRDAASQVVLHETDDQRLPWVVGWEGTFL